jgi:O-antigen ligase
VLLLCLFFPAIIGWLFGKAGPKRIADYFIIVFTLWCMVALIGADGFSISIEPMGMLAIETLGAYFLGRTFVRTRFQFWSFCKWLTALLMILLPLAVLEAYMNRVIALEVLGKVWKTHIGVFLDRPGRMGLRRAQVTFEHPILFGLFVANGYGLLVYSIERSKVGVKAWWRVVLVAANTFFSLSTGAYLAVGVQLILTAWEFATRTVKSRWKILLAIVIFAYVSVDLMSNRSPFQVFVSYMTFDQSTSYNRILIWQFGTQQVMATPVFGIGLTGEWARPWWMNPSMDNFWLLIAVRHGVPAFVLMMAAIYFIIRDVVKAKLTTPEHLNIRLGWMFTLVSMFVAICSVHLWNATYCFLFFLLGAGLWMADVDDSIKDNADSPLKPEETSSRKIRNFRPAIRPGQAEGATARVTSKQ